MTKVHHYVLTHVINENGDLKLNPSICQILKDEDVTLVINNTSRFTNKEGHEWLFPGELTVLTLDCNGVSLARNKIIEDFISHPEYTHMTMIDGDDEISADYHEVLQRFAERVHQFGIFNGVWVYPDGRKQGIFNFSSRTKVIKYAQHYTNWLYLYSQEFLKEARYPDVEGYDFPEDEYFYSYIASWAADHNYHVPINASVLYFYLQGNSEVAKMDSDTNNKLAAYLGNRSMLRVNDLI